MIGAVLKWTVAHGQPHSVIDNLISRIKAWWVMVGLISLSFVFGKTGVILLFLFISFAALREYITLTYTRSGDHMALALMFYVALPMQYFLIWIEWYGMFSIFIPVHVFLVLPILASLSGDTNRFLERTAKMQWGMMICLFCLSHLPALLTLEIPGYEDRNLLLIAYLMLVVQGSDILQYVWGKLLGKRKVAPHLSPSKTIGGLVGGVASATLVGASLYWITPFTPWQSALVSLVICLMGFLGGLVSISDAATTGSQFHSSCSRKCIVLAQRISSFRLNSSFKANAFDCCFRASIWRASPNSGVRFHKSAYNAPCYDKATTSHRSTISRKCRRRERQTRSLWHDGRYTQQRARYD